MRGGIIGGSLVLSLGLLLAGCGDPLSEVPRYSEVPLAADAGQADAVAPDTPRTPATNAPPRRGLLGLFGARAAAAKGEPVAETPDTDLDEAAPEAELAAAPAPAPVRRGLFGSKPARRSGGSDGSEVQLGVVVPYGQVARLCGVPTSKLGRKVESYPERSSRYDLYDSAPGTTSAHTYYLTGFKDNCARQFTAALVIFGSPESYEQIHYGPSGDTQPVSETDKAYEQIKRRVCGVGTGKPCGSRMRSLARDTVFVSVYERFGSNPRWKNILLHDGEVAAVDLKN
ncbi:hypothetical protein [Maliponia aquimaris]|uniref:Uncharacterized protein n=1 Tax=Maliponia aquimaris TaxID=1673631 RepID=A0A238L7E5_9RHOB|nr:hypothetical protein [Maliponia aquimaris]SMX50760.1 hypothetical protein MAA8898_04972 [Maliponia aquimaris]